MILKASTGEYGDAVAEYYDHFYRHYEDQYLIADYCKRLLPKARRVLKFGIIAVQLNLSAAVLAHAAFNLLVVAASARSDRRAGLDSRAARGG